MDPIRRSVACLMLVIYLVPATTEPSELMSTKYIVCA